MSLPHEAPIFKQLHYFLTYRAKVLECSAKEDQNVTDLFKTLLSLSRFLPVGSNNDGTSGLKRRSSAYVTASSSRSKYTYSQIYTEQTNLVCLEKAATRAPPQELVVVMKRKRLQKAQHAN